MKRLAFTNIPSLLVVAELGALIWLVYGGMASMGMPGAFWNENPWIELYAGMGVTLFYFWMLYLLFVQDYDRHRHHEQGLDRPDAEPGRGEQAVAVALSAHPSGGATEYARGSGPRSPRSSRIPACQS